MTSVPAYLTEYAQRYAESPREAALEWFREASFGLFVHYGLYSILGRHEWVQYRERIPVAEYEKLQNSFTAAGFDAAEIADLAVQSGMRYVTFTTRHHDSFCLWHTQQSDFHSVDAPAGRDLVAELAEACERRGLGLFLYYSHGRDWRHPHAPNNDEWGGRARPEYDPPDPAYAYGADHRLDVYLDFVHAQITELLTGYGPVAGIWLDGIAVPLSGEHTRLDCQRLYDHIHSLQPQVLVSYKQGLLGTEDFYAPEHEAVETGGKPGEICTTMCPGSWGYLAEGAGRHRNGDDVLVTLESAKRQGFNLLLNTGPLADGSIDPEDATVLRQVGRRLRGLDQ